MFKLRTFIAPIYIFLAIKFSNDINLFTMIKNVTIFVNSKRHHFHGSFALSF